MTAGMVIFHCPLEQRTCTSVYVDKYSAPSRSHLNDLAAWLRAFPDRDVLQRLLTPPSFGFVGSRRGGRFRRIRLRRAKRRCSPLLVVMSFGAPTDTTSIIGRGVYHRSGIEPVGSSSLLLDRRRNFRKARREIVTVAGEQSAAWAGAASRCL